MPDISLDLQTITCPAEGLAFTWEQSPDAQRYGLIVGLPGADMPSVLDIMSNRSKAFALLPIPASYTGAVSTGWQGGQDWQIGLVVVRGDLTLAPAMHLDTVSVNSARRDRPYFPLKRPDLDRSTLTAGELRAPVRTADAGLLPATPAQNTPVWPWPEQDSRGAEWEPSPRDFDDTPSIAAGSTWQPDQGAHDLAAKPIDETPVHAAQATREESAWPGLDAASIEHAQRPADANTPETYAGADKPEVLERATPQPPADGYVPAAREHTWSQAQSPETGASARAGEAEIPAGRPTAGPSRDPELLEADNAIRIADYWTAIDIFERILDEKPQSEDARRGAALARSLAGWPTTFAAAAGDAVRLERLGDECLGLAPEKAYQSYSAAFSLQPSGAALRGRLHALARTGRQSELLTCAREGLAALQAANLLPASSAASLDIVGRAAALPINDLETAIEEFSAAIGAAR